MAVPFLTITQIEAATMLKESIGALTVQSTIGQVITAVRPPGGGVPILEADPGSIPFTLNERRVIIDSLDTYSASALGTFSFVFPYERYQKVIMAANAALNPGLNQNQAAAAAAAIHRQDPSEAFGLSQYSDVLGSPAQLLFVAHFPGTIVTSWGIDMINQPGGAPPLPKRTWVADVIRNALAHAQIETVAHGNNLGVRLTNRRNAAAVGVYNFDVWIPVRQFERLVATALTSFITNVVVGGNYEPLNKLLILSH